jgi:hypothetical protein
MYRVKHHDPCRCVHGRVRTTDVVSLQLLLLLLPLYLVQKYILVKIGDISRVVRRPDVTRRAISCT